MEWSSYDKVYFLIIINDNLRSRLSHSKTAFFILMNLIWTYLKRQYYLSNSELKKFYFLNVDLVISSKKKLWLPHCHQVSKFLKGLVWLRIEKNSCAKTKQFNQNLSFIVSIEHSLHALSKTNIWARIKDNLHEEMARNFLGLLILIWEFYKTFHLLQIREIMVFSLAWRLRTLQTWLITIRVSREKLPV